MREITDLKMDYIGLTTHPLPHHTLTMTERESPVVIETTKYVRKPFYIEAVRVTAENMDEVAKWARGTIHVDGEERYIKIKVHRPLNIRQTQAFVGNWVLSAGTGFKVFTAKAFAENFELVEKPIPAGVGG